MGNSASATSGAGVRRKGKGDNIVTLSQSTVRAEIATATKRSRSKLNALIKANHLNYSILYKNNNFYNSLAQHLASAHLFGAPSARLFELFEIESRNLEPWLDAPSEVSRADWNLYFGDKRYARAYLDYFEDEVVRQNYDWKRVVQKYCIEGEDQLLFGMISGACHPLIHLAYAYELNNVEMATEALAFACVDRDYMHKYVDAKVKYKSFVNGAYSPLYPNPSSEPNSRTILDILSSVRADSRFDNMFTRPGYWNLAILLASREDIVLEYFNEWQVTNHEEALEEITDVAVLLLLPDNVTADPTTPPTEDTTNEKLKTPTTAGDPVNLFLLHLLTGSHAVRILMHNLPASCHHALPESMFLTILCYYIAELRPSIRTHSPRPPPISSSSSSSSSAPPPPPPPPPPSSSTSSSPPAATSNTAITTTTTNAAAATTWDTMRTTLLESDNGDPHFIKALNCLMEAEAAFGYKNSLYIDTARIVAMPT